MSRGADDALHNRCTRFESLASLFLGKRLRLEIFPLTVDNDLGSLLLRLGF